MATKKEKENFDKIENLFSRLADIVDSQEFHNQSTAKALELECENFRGWSNFKIKAKCSILNFTLTNLNHVYTAKDFISTRIGCFMCFAFAEKYKEEIENSFSQEEIDFIFDIWMKI